jgi:hypothetical protein
MKQRERHGRHKDVFVDHLVDDLHDSSKWRCLDISLIAALRCNLTVIVYMFANISIQHYSKGDFNDTLCLQTIVSTCFASIV